MDSVRTHLIRRDAAGKRGERVLFLTFSRTAVTQILDRSRGILKDVADRVDVLTFHGFAWRLITDFGRYAGYGPDPQLRSDAEFVDLHLGPDDEAAFLDDAERLMRQYFLLEDPTAIRGPRETPNVTRPGRWLISCTQSM